MSEYCARENLSPLRKALYVIRKTLYAIGYIIYSFLFTFFWLVGLLLQLPSVLYVVLKWTLLLMFVWCIFNAFFLPLFR